MEKTREGPSTSHGGGGVLVQLGVGVGVGEMVSVIAGTVVDCAEQPYLVHTHAHTRTHTRAHTRAHVHARFSLLLSPTPSQIVTEKSKYRRTPVNYAMTKNRLIMEKVAMTTITHTH